MHVAGVVDCRYNLCCSVVCAQKEMAGLPYGFFLPIYCVGYTPRTSVCPYEIFYIMLSVNSTLFIRVHTIQFFFLSFFMLSFHQKPTFFLVLAVLHFRLILFNRPVRRIVQVSHKPVKFASRDIPEQYRPITLRHLASFSMVERFDGSVIFTDSVKHETWRKNKGVQTLLVVTRKRNSFSDFHRVHFFYMSESKKPGYLRGRYVNINSPKNVIHQLFSFSVNCHSASHSIFNR